MSNFQTALDATATAYNSAGSAAEENQKVVDSLQGKLASVRASFEQLANTVIDSDLISGVLDLANAFLQLLNTPIGAFVTQVALMTGVLGGLGAVLKYFAPVGIQFVNAFGLIMRAITNVGFAASGAAGPVLTMGSAFTAAGGAAAVAFPLIAAGVAIIWLVVKAVDALTTTLEEQKEIVNNLSSEISSLQSKYDQLLAKDDKTTDEQRYLDLLEKEIQLKKESLALAAQTGYEKEYGKKTTTYSDKYGSTYTVEIDPVANILKSAKAYAEYDESVAKTAEEVRDLREAHAEEGIALTDSIKELEAYKEQMEGDNVVQKGEKEIIEQINATLEVLYTSLGITKTATEEETVATNNFVIKQKSLTTVLSEVSGAYDILTKAQNETKESGAISASTLESLLKDYPELEQYLVQTKNGYVLTKGALDDYISSQKIEYETKLTKAKEAAEAVIDAQDEETKAYLKTTGAIENQMMALISLTQMKLFDKYGNDVIGRQLASQDATLKQYEGILNSYLNAQKNIKTLEGVLSGLGATTAASSAKSSAKTVTDSALSTFQSYYKDLQHLRDMDEIDDEKYYGDLAWWIKWYTNTATTHMKEYGLDSNTIRQNMYSYEEELAKHTADVVKAQEAAKEKAVEKAIEAHKKELELQKSAYESLFDIVTNNIQNEIDALEKEKESKSEYYQKQIDALNETNDALEEQIALEEALDALAKAKSNKVMVYKDGRYQYVSDIDAVSEAQTSLDKIEREQALKQEVDNLEQLKKKATASIDEQIDEWEKYKAQWSSVVSSYSKKQNMLLVEQQLGIKLEGDNWRKRIDNLDAYVSEYNKTLGKIDTISGISNDGASYTDAVIAEMKKNTSAWHSASAIGKQELSAKNLELGSLLGWSRNEAKGVWYTAEGKRAYAQGTTSAQGGMSLVGEQGPEMRVLGKGDGILPADITKNLWSWGMTTPSSMLSALSGVGSSSVMNIQVGTFSFPNMTNQSNISNFLEELKGFKRYAIQYGTGL